MEKSNHNFKVVDTLPEMEGLRLDKALSLNSQISSRSRAENLIQENRVHVNGKAAKASHKVSLSDIIEIDFPSVKSLTLDKLNLQLDIKFEDESLIVINKPAGLVVHPAAGHENDTLVNALVAYSNDFLMKFKDQRPGIVHRLDKDTSGLLVIAKNDLVLEALAKQFKSRTVHRLYQALTVGTPFKKKDRICSFIARHPVDRRRYSSVLGKDKKTIRNINTPPSMGKWAATNYEVLKEHVSGLGLMQLKLETGRTHQIRVHLAEIGSPIVSDPLYGNPTKQKNIEGRIVRELLQEHSKRCALHATELGFEHPITKKNLSFKVDWPDHHPILDFLKSK